MSSDDNKTVRPRYVHKDDRDWYHWLKDRYCELDPPPSIGLFDDFD